MSRLRVDHVVALPTERVVPATKIYGLAYDHGADAKLADQAAAIPTRRQRRDHDFVAVTPLPARFAKRVRFAMRRRIAFLHPAGAAASEKFSIAFEYRRAYGNSSFTQPHAGLFHRDFHPWRL